MGFAVAGRPRIGINALWLAPRSYPSIRCIVGNIAKRTVSRSRAEYVREILVATDFTLLPRLQAVARRNIVGAFINVVHRRPHTWLQFLAVRINQLLVAIVFDNAVDLRLTEIARSTPPVWLYVTIGDVGLVRRICTVDVALRQIKIHHPRRIKVQVWTTPIAFFAIVRPSANDLAIEDRKNSILAITPIHPALLYV